MDLYIKESYLLVSSIKGSKRIISRVHLGATHISSAGWHFRGYSRATQIRISIFGSISWINYNILIDLHTSKGNFFLKIGQYLTESETNM